ncbi:MAG: sugar-binding protein, partial [Armatimonadota bacterium]
QDLVRIYQTAYPALHEADPKAIVIGPTGAGISAGDVAWNERLLQAGLGKYVDAWAIHPYIGQPSEDHDLIANIRALKELIRTNVGHDLDLYGTEQGYPTDATEVKEKPQARWLTRSYLITVGEGFKMNTAFYSCDYPGEPGYGFFHNLVMDKQAWGPGVVGPKAAAAAFAAMTMVLEGHKSLGPIEGLGPSTLGYAFERDNRVTLALWDYGQQPRDLTLMAGVPEVEIIDWMGNARTESASNGTLKLTLGPEPQYVRGVSPALWGSKAKKPLVVQTSSLSTFAGDTLKLQVLVSPPTGISGAATLTARLGEGLAEITKPLSVQAGKPTTVVLDLPIPATIEAGAYPVQLSARSGERLFGMTSAMVRLRDAVTIESVRSLGLGKLQVGLRNLRPTATQGTLAIRLPGVPSSRAQQSFKLPAQTAAAFALDLSAATVQPGRTYAAKLTLQEQRGLPHVSTRSLTLTDFHRAPGNLKIDGDLSEWAGIAPIRLQGRECLVRQPQLYRGRDDLSASVRCAWDKTALYLAVDVIDDKYLQDNSGFNTWKGDCLQVAFDTQPADKQELTGNTLADNASRGNVEIDLALTANGPEVYRTLSA